MKANNIYRRRGLWAATFTVVGFTLFLGSIALLIFESFSGVGLIILILLTISGFVLLSAGNMIYERNSRAAVYFMLMTGRKSLTFEELAEMSGYPVSFIKMDLKSILKKNMMPSFILNDTGLEVTVKTEIPAEELENIKKEDKVSAALTDGRDYLKKISKANYDLPGKAMSERLSKLEDLTEQIFNHIERHPEKLPEIKAFMSRHLPMTIKLVESYGELASFPTGSQSVAAAKEDIHRAIDTINHAFENLLDDLLRSMAVDVSADIEVLKSVLSQDGLIDKNPFGLKRK